MKDEINLPKNRFGYPKYTGQCGHCRYMKIFKYYDKMNDTWWSGFTCAIPDKITGSHPDDTSENVFRAIGNKNKNNNCKDYTYIGEALPESDE